MTTELNERKCLLFVIIKRRTRAIIRTERNLTAHLGILARLTRRWVVKTVERVPATMAYSDAEWAHINDEFKRTKGKRCQRIPTVCDKVRVQHDRL